MKSTINFKIIKLILPLALGVILVLGCKKETNNSYETYEKVDSLAASFTVTPVQGNDTKFVIANTTPGECIGARWDVGKGSGPLMGKRLDTVFYPLAGSYTIKMWALDKRARLYSAPPITVTTTKNDPAYDNLIKGGKMNAGDSLLWIKLNTNVNVNPSATKITWTLANNQYTATTTSKPVTNSVGGAIYQAVQVVANKTYRFATNVSYGVAQDAWVEVYLGQTQIPTEGKDYTDNKKLGVLTWGTWTAFNGTKTFDLTFGSSGTVYVVIKVGCNASNGHLSTQGVSIWNVDFRRIQE